MCEYPGKIIVKFIENFEEIKYPVFTETLTKF